MSELDGLSRTQCAAACKVDRCVISESAVCAHPCMNGLQSPRVGDVLVRYAAACRLLGVKNFHEVKA